MMKHFTGIKRFYKQRRDVIARLADKHLSGSYNLQIANNPYCVICLFSRQFFVELLLV